MFKAVHLVFTLILGTSIVIGCSNDEIIGTGVTSLSLPSSVNLLDTDINTQVNNVGAANNLAAESLPVNNVTINTILTDPDTDYSTDTAILLFKDRATEESRSANYVLCLMGKLKYSEKLNAGPYKVVANLYHCMKTFSPDWVQSDKSTFTVEGTVTSSRADNNSPHIIAAWLTYNYHIEIADTILNNQFQELIDISIFDNVSNKYPYGNFIINSASVIADKNNGATIAVESRIGKSTIKSFLENNKTPVYKTADYSTQDSGNFVDFDASSIYWPSGNKNSGAMQTKLTSTDNSDPNSIDTNSKTNLLRFNESNLLTSRFKDPSEIIANQSCFSRDEIYDEYGGYNLYHNVDSQFRGNTASAGDRVKLTSYFNFTYSGQKGSIRDGNYSLNNEAVLPDGAIITGSDDGKRYTAHVANGALDETRNMPIALSVLQNRQLAYSGSHPRSGKSGDWILSVDENNDLVVIKTVTNSSIGNVLSDTYDHDDDDTTPEVSVLATLTFTNGDSIRFLDDSFVQYNYVYDINAAANERSATYSTYRRVTAGNTDLFSESVTSIKLYCYSRCPKGGLTPADVESAAGGFSDVYHPGSTFNTTPRIYSLNSAGFKIQLVDDSNNLPVDVSNLDQTTFGQISITSGKLTATPLPVDATEATLDQLAVTYAWTTRTASRFSTVTLSNSNNELVVFDEPIKLQYTYDATDDIYNTNPNTNIRQGQQYYLTYINNYLSGLPINFDTSGFLRNINLADGTVLPSTEGEFVTRARIIARLLQRKPVSDCASINLDGLTEDKNLTLMTIDDIIEVPFTSADRPEVKSPTVISP